jgi:ribosomal protein L12E/L44/L45/RPP1/RPP2
MKKEENTHTDELFRDDPRIGEEVNSIRFSDFVKHLTGVSFEEVFNNFSSKDKRQNEKIDME